MAVSVMVALAMSTYSPPASAMPWPSAVTRTVFPVMVEALMASLPLTTMPPPNALVIPSGFVLIEITMLSRTVVALMVAVPFTEIPPALATWYCTQDRNVGLRRPNTQ